MFPALATLPPPRPLRTVAIVKVIVTAAVAAIVTQTAPALQVQAAALVAPHPAAPSPHPVARLRMKSLLRRRPRSPPDDAFRGRLTSLQQVELLKGYASFI